jgi:hypothetical protein
MNNKLFLKLYISISYVFYFIKHIKKNYNVNYPGKTKRLIKRDLTRSYLITSKCE